MSDNVENENLLRIGKCPVEEVLDRVTAFRLMNNATLKKRYLISLEDLQDEDGNVICKNGDEIHLEVARKIKSLVSIKKMISVFQPDEGIVVVTEPHEQESRYFSSELLVKLHVLGSGGFEGYLDHISSFYDLLELMQKALFPRLIIIGHFPRDRNEFEYENYLRIKRIDRYVKAVELLHPVYKPNPVFTRVKGIRLNVAATPEDPWNSVIDTVIKEYNKPYYVEDF